MSPQVGFWELAQNEEGLDFQRDLKGQVWNPPDFLHGQIHLIFFFFNIGMV